MKSTYGQCFVGVHSDDADGDQSMMINEDDYDDDGDDVNDNFWFLILMMIDEWFSIIKSIS